MISSSAAVCRCSSSRAALACNSEAGTPAPDQSTASASSDSTYELPPTKLWRVAVSFTCGDGCYTGWKLYDPAAKKFVDAAWTGQVNDAWVARDGSAFVKNGVVIRFDRGPLAETPEGESLGGGWLGGAYYYR